MDAEFGGNNVLAVMRPPDQQLKARGTVSILEILVYDLLLRSIIDVELVLF